MPRIKPCPHRNMALGQHTHWTILPSMTKGLDRFQMNSRRTDEISVPHRGMIQ